MFRLRSHALPEFPERELTRIYLLCYVAGYFGARLLSIPIEQGDVRGVMPWVDALLQFGPMTFYGGALAAALAAGLYCLVRRLSLGDVFDLGLPAGLLGLALGRIGCFLNGDDYGKAVGDAASSPFWAVVFPNLGDGLARYPVQLMESGFAALLSALLVCKFSAIRASLRPGAVAILGALAYGNIRFALEFLRDDFRGSVLAPWLSTSQFISLIIVLGIGLSAPIWMKRKKTSSNEP